MTTTFNLFTTARVVRWPKHMGNAKALCGKSLKGPTNIVSCFVRAEQAIDLSENINQVSLMYSAGLIMEHGQL